MGIPIPHALGCTFWQMCRIWLLLKIVAAWRQSRHGKGKIMARPKKEKQLTRTHHINLRLTETQYEIISEASKQAGLSLSEYVRAQLSKGKVVAKYEIVADVPELKKLIAEFGRIGNNLNQIARRFNLGGIHSQEMQKAVRQCIAEIFEM